MEEESEGNEEHKGESVERAGKNQGEREGWVGRVSWSIF